MIVGDATVLIRAVESPEAQKVIENVGKKVEAQMGKSGERAGRNYRNGFQRSMQGIDRIADRLADRLRLALRRSVGVMGESLAYLSGTRFLAEQARGITDFLTSIDEMLPKFALLSNLIVGAIGWVGGLVGQVFTMVGDLQTVPALLAPVPGLIMGAVTAIVLLVVALKDAKTELAPLKDEMQALGNTISSGFWSEAREPIIDLVETIFPSLNTALKGASEALGRFFGSLADGFKNNLTPDVIKEIFDSFSEGFDILAGAGDAFAGVLTNFALIASDYWPAIAQSISNAAQEFDSWLTRIRDDGSLDAWIQDAQEKLTHLWNGIKQFGGVLSGINTAFNNAGFDGLAAFEDAMTRWNRTVNDPRVQEALTNVFVGFRAAFDGFNQAIGFVFAGILNQSDAVRDSFIAIGDGLIEIGYGLGTIFNNEGFASGVTSMFQDFAAALSNIQPAIDPLANKLGAIARFVGDMAVAFSGPFTAVIIALEEPFNQILEAMTIIVESLAPEMQRIFQSSEFSNIMQGVADAVLRFAEIVRDRLPQLRPIIDTILEVVETLAMELPTLIEVLEPAIDLLIELAPVIEIVGAALQMFIIGFTAGLRGLVTLVEATVSMLRVYIEAITTFIGRTGEIIQGLLSGEMAIWEIGPALSEAFAEANQIVADGASDIGTQFNEDMAVIGGDAAISLIRAFGEDMGMDTSMVNAIVDNLSGEDLARVYEIMQTQGAEAALQYAQGLLASATENVDPAAADTRDRVSRTIGETEGLLRNAGSKSGTALAEGIASKVLDAENSGKLLKEGADKQVAILEGALKTRGTTSGTNLATALAEKTAAVAASATGLKDAADSNTKSLPDLLKGHGSKGGQGVSDGIRAKIGAVGDSAAAMMKTISTKTSGQYDVGAKVGNQLGDGMKAGINAKVASVAQAAAAMVRAATAAAQGAARIASPSRLWRDDIGKQLSAGAAIGIEQGATLVQRAAGKAIPSITLPGVITPIGVGGRGIGGRGIAEAGIQSASISSGPSQVNLSLDITITGNEHSATEIAASLEEKIRENLSSAMNNGGM